MLKKNMVLAWDASPGVPSEALTLIQKKERKALFMSALIFGQYKPRFWWFESVECMKKVVLTSAIIFIEPGSSNQMMVAAAVCLCMVFVYFSLRPVATVLSHMLKIAFTFMLFFNLAVGLGVKNDFIDGEAPFWTALIYTLNATVLFLPALVAVG